MQCSAHRVHIFTRDETGQCICPLSWSVHCNFTGDGKCNKRGWACTPHPHQPRLILPSWLNVRQKADVTTLVQPAVVRTEYILLLEMKQGYCTCSWSVHCNFTGDGKCSERGWACTPHPHHPGLILPLLWNVRQKATVATLYSVVVRTWLRIAVHVLSIEFFAVRRMRIWISIRTDNNGSVSNGSYESGTQAVLQLLFTSDQWVHQECTVCMSINLLIANFASPRQSANRPLLLETQIFQFAYQ